MLGLCNERLEGNAMLLKTLHARRAVAPTRAIRPFWQARPAPVQPAEHVPSTKRLAFVPDLVSQVNL